MKTAITPQLEPISLRAANRLLMSVGRVYPQDFQHVITAARWACRSAYTQQGALGVFVTLMNFVRELQFVLPKQYGDPSLLQAARQAHKNARSAAAKPSARTLISKFLTPRKICVIFVIILVLSALLRPGNQDVSRPRPTAQPHTSQSSTIAAPIDQPLPQSRAAGAGGSPLNPTAVAQSASGGQMTSPDPTQPTPTTSTPTSSPAIGLSGSTGDTGEKDDNANGGPTTTSTASPTPQPIVPTASPTSALPQPIVPTATSTAALPSATSTPVPTATSHVVPPVITNTPAKTNTPITRATNTPTNTPTPTATSTPTPTATSTPTPTATSTPGTPTPTPCSAVPRPSVDIALVFDRSGSMNGDPFNDAKDAGKYFAQLTDLTRNQIAVISFASTEQMEIQLSHELSPIETAIDTMQNDHGSAISAGINLARQELTSERHTPAAGAVIILLSDGKGDEPDNVTLAAANLAKSQGIRIITIRLGKGSDKGLMGELASPNDAYTTAESAELRAIYEAIARPLSGCDAPVQPNPTPTPAQTALASVADTYVSESAPDKKDYGDDKVMKASASGPERWALLRFQTSGATVHRATLRLYVVEAAEGVYIASTTTTWDEQTTWNSRPQLSSTRKELGPVTQHSWVEVDVTEMLQPDGTLSIAIRSGSAHDIELTTREGGTNGPQLVIQ